MIIVDDAADDALAGLARNSEAVDRGIEVVRLSDFLHQEGFEFDERLGGLRRSGPVTETGGRHQGPILDRVIEISNRSLANLDGRAGILWRGQASAAYQQALEEHRALRAGELAYSTVGQLLPLPTQWRIVAENFPEVGIPAYKHGYGPELVPADNFARPVFKSPFDLYSWKPNERPEGVVWDQFIVDAPDGFPILSYFLGAAAVTASLRPGAPEPSPAVAARLADFTLRIGAIFNAGVGEVLWFLDGETMVFGGFSHLLAAARRHADFERHATRYLEEYFAG
jgi:hypothetical protein